MSKKYFSISKQYLKLYPKYDGSIIASGVVKEKRINKQKQGEISGKVGSKRKVVRPKKHPAMVSGLQTLTKFFRRE